MATLFTIDYEAGTAGNSVGSESGWTSNAPAGVYNAGAAEAGSLGIKITTQAVHRIGVSSISAFRVRWYNEVPVIAPGAATVLAQARLSGTAKAGVRLETAGTYRLTNGASATGSSSASLVANTRDRLEWWVDGTAGTCGLDIFRGTNRNGNIPDEQLTGTFTNSTVDDIGVCFPVIATSFVVLQDEIKATDTPASQIGGVNPLISVPAEAATATGVSADPLSGVKPNAGAGTATGASNDSGIAIGANAEASTATVTAPFDPTGSGGGLTLISDNPVVVVGVAGDATTRITVNAAVALSTAAAGDIASSTLQAVFPGVATGLAEANDVDNLLIFVYAEIAQGIGESNDVNVAPLKPVYVGPIRIETWPIQPGERLAVKVTVNQTLYRRNGVWLVGENLSYTDFDGADRVYVGGYDPNLTDAQFAELIAAGLSQYVQFV